MPATRRDLMERLDALGIASTTLEHAPVFTVEQSSALHHAIPGGHTKNLFLKDHKGRLFLIIAHAHTRIDLKALAKAMGCGRLSFASPGLLMEVLGVPPGSVTALALINDNDRRVGVVIDTTLLAFDTVNCHPLENSATTSIARSDLLRFIRACGHEPRILYPDQDQERGGEAGGGHGSPAGEGRATARPSDDIP
jgi:Ala-tRNA(Pro) deacylase